MCSPLLFGMKIEALSLDLRMAKGGLAKDR